MRSLTVVTVALLLAACGSDSSSSTSDTVAPATSATTIESTTTVAATTTTVAPPTELTYLALGDSHSYGLPEECNNCVTYPYLLDDQFAVATGLPMTLIDGTQHNSLTASLLLSELQNDAWGEPADIPPVRTSLSPREAVAAADIVTIAVGMNDTPWYRGFDCGKVYDEACISATTESYRADIDGILSEIDEIREGRPTAVRVISVFNDLIAGGDYEALWFFAPVLVDQALTGGKALVASWTEALCVTAAAHHAQCVDANALFNGPGRDQPMAGGYFVSPLAGDLNQRGHDEIAAAIVAMGLSELTGP
jgi:hypothetical protein